MKMCKLHAVYFPNAVCKPSKSMHKSIIIFHFTFACDNNSAWLLLGSFLIFQTFLIML